MCFFSSPSMPAPPPPPARPPEPPRDADPAVKAARDDARRRAAGMQGYGSTIATSGQGVTGKAVTTALKNLLGE